MYMQMYATSDLMVTPEKHVFQVWSAILTLAVGDLGVLYGVLYCVLFIVYCLLCIVYCVLCIVSCVLYIVYCV